MLPKLRKMCVKAFLKQANKSSVSDLNIIACVRPILSRQQVEKVAKLKKKKLFGDTKDKQNDLEEPSSETKMKCSISRLTFVLVCILEPFYNSLTMAKRRR